MKLQKVHFKQKINLALNIIRSITIQSPNKSSVLIYDNENSEVIKKYVLADLSYSILYTRREKIFLSPNIIYNMVKRLFSGTLFGGSFLSKLYRAYLISYIEYVDPKVVITMIDNDILYYVISNYFPNVKFYAIQNGTRFQAHITTFKSELLKFENDQKNSLYNVTLFCFGEKERSFFSNSNITLKDIIPAGSLKESIYRDIFQKDAGNNEIYDICLISQYRKDIIDGNYPEILSPGALHNLNQLNNYLKKLIDDTGYKLCIARCTNDEGEVEYFRKFFGDSISFIAHSPELFSTYSAMDSSKLVVVYHSTCGFEAIGQDKKVLFCVPESFKSNLFGDLIVPMIFAPNEEYLIFNRKVTSLTNMDQKTYLAEMQESKRYLMNNNEDVPIYIYLRDSIQKS